MGLSDILAAGIAIADGVTKDVQGSITWEAWTGQNWKGEDTYADPVTLRAIIDQTRKRKFNGDGQLITVVASLTILETVTPNGTVTVPPRQEPIDTRDKITLPDGTTGPILEGPGAVYNPVAARPFLNEIYLGEP
jgi:hypothetical protein